jgi:hypothetical protein
MYLEYKVINGVLHYRTSPHGEFMECTKEVITKLFTEAELKYNNLLSITENLSSDLEESIYTICRLCYRVNPQHKDCECTSCPEIDNYKISIKKFKTFD